MANLLDLVHLMPYPPDKGDKVRSFHLLKHLVAQHRVFVGTFMDDPADAVHVEPLRALCAGLHVAVLNPRTRKRTIAKSDVYWYQYRFVRSQNDGASRATGCAPSRRESTSIMSRMPR